MAVEERGITYRTLDLSTGKIDIAPTVQIVVVLSTYKDITEFEIRAGNLERLWTFSSRIGYMLRK